MAYNKLTIESFKKSLAEGKYGSSTGARRAIGKATTFSEDELTKARKLIDSHFGAEASADKPVKAVKKTAKKAATKLAAPVKGRPGPKPKNLPKPAKTGKRGRKANASASVSEQSLQFAPIPKFDGGTTSNLQVGEAAVERFSQAMTALSEIKKQYPSIDLSTHVHEASNGLMSAMVAFRNVVDRVSAKSTVSKAAKLTDDVQVEEEEETVELQSNDDEEEPSILTNGAGRSTFEEALPHA